MHPIQPAHAADPLAVTFLTCPTRGTITEVAQINRAHSPSDPLIGWGCQAGADEAADLPTACGRHRKEPRGSHRVTMIRFRSYRPPGRQKGETKMVSMRVCVKEVPTLSAQQAALLKRSTNNQNDCS